MIEDNLTGRVIVITGAAGGIGRGLAAAAAKRGMKIVLADLHDGETRAAADALAREGASVIAVPTDVTDPVAVVRLADAAYSAFGSVHVLINNAGVEVSGKSWQISDADWRRTIDVNLMGPVNGIRAFVPRLLAAGEPAQVVIVSSLGALGSIGGQAPYMASKHAAFSLAESLYLELADEPNVDVSVVLPAAVATAIWNNALGLTDDPQRREMVAMLAEHGVNPDAAAEMILSQLAERRFWITTDADIMTRAANARAGFLTGQRHPAPSW